MLYLRIALLAPGVMLHEFSHHLLCILSGVRVRKVVYFRMGNPAGFVVHEEPDLYRQMFAIVAGPFLINSAASVILLNLAMRQWARSVEVVGWAAVASLVWLGISAALQALPSRADAVNLCRSSNRHLRRGNPFALFGYPAAVAIYAANLARPLGAEWFYTLLMAYLAQRGFAGLG